MTRDALATASDRLASAAQSADSDDDGQRLSELADQLDRLSTADEGPDHGRLARIQNALHDLEDSTEGDATDAIAEAHEHVKEYRSGVEGV
ncbi:hypothetical protein [Halomicrobium sp. LC1Hm]|uniref:DUF7553 family protein n=1 Tax=Halomicrobium sp. LC1Hm TaxID=2610902 RepID=UPI00129825D8|nr:hypothetical protein [Halomicrobium sp. LC1Hm]QGA81630.1 Uncharacterized protein LC1Hm_0566 [Halomicrobium sp. LC1Hm]